MNKTILSAYYCKEYNSQNINNIVNIIIKNICNLTNIKKNSKILIKPNLLNAFLPEQAITTHPEIIRAIIKIVKDFDAIPIIGDSPDKLSNGINEVWQKTGIFQVAKEENVELIDFEKEGFDEYEISHSTIKKVCISKTVKNYDYIINVPKLKTHAFMGFSCGIKNLYGFVPGEIKMSYHQLTSFNQLEFSYLLSEIYKIVKDKILFTIVDGVYGLEGNGPSLYGDKRNYSILVGSNDTVTLDTFIIDRIGLKFKNDFFLKPLKEKSLGNYNLQNIIYIGDSICKFNFNQTKLPITKVCNFYEQ